MEALKIFDDYLIKHVAENTKMAGSIKCKCQNKSSGCHRAYNKGMDHKYVLYLKHDKSNFAIDMELWKGTFS